MMDAFMKVLEAGRAAIAFYSHGQGRPGHQPRLRQRQLAGRGRRH
jgi:hypothetical protein